MFLLIYLFRNPCDREQLVGEYTCKCVEGIDRRMSTYVFVGAVYQSQIGSWLDIEFVFINAAGALCLLVSSRAIGHSL